MSDTETEDVSAETVIEYIENAVEDLRVTNDYISYATVLEVNLEDPMRFSDEEKGLILQALYKVLEDNLDIVEEIGWDLPSMLLPFLDQEWDYEEGSLLTSTDVVKYIVRIMDLLAKKGNPKELFIRSIELLTSLDYSDMQTPKREKILDVRFYTLLELLSSSIKRINTIYPSKFLAMALSCLLTCFVKYTDHNSHQRFAMRKLYIFARDYLPPMKPLDWLKEHGLTQEEAYKLDDDENYLQRKLLQSFVTHLTALGFKEYCLFFSVEYFSLLKLQEMGKIPSISQTERDYRTSTREVSSRVVGLAMSFDFDLDKELIDIKGSSVELLQKAQKIVDEKKATTKTEELEDDQLIQTTVGLCLNDALSYAFHPDQKTIPINTTGLLNLCTQYAYEAQTHGHTPTPRRTTLLEAVSMHIRFLSPALLSSQFFRQGTMDSVLLHDWAAVSRATPAQFKEIPKYMRILFLQTTIHFACTDHDPTFRMVLFTLFVRVLTHLDEDEAYGFIVDTLATAPLESAKAGMLTVLKDFLIRVRSGVDDLSARLEKTSVKEGQAAPPLPKRYYIELTPSRCDDIYALARECLDDTFEGETVDGARFKTLLGFLNLFVVIKERFPQDMLSEIVSLTNEKLKLGKKCDDESTNVEFAALAIEPLTGYIRQKKQTTLSSSSTA